MFGFGFVFVGVKGIWDNEISEFIMEMFNGVGCEVGEMLGVVGGYCIDRF